MKGSVQGSAVTFSKPVAGSYRILINFVSKGFAKLPDESVWEVHFKLPNFTITDGN